MLEQAREALVAEGRRRAALAGAGTAQRCAAVACGRAVGTAEALLDAAARLDVRSADPPPLSLTDHPWKYFAFS